MKNAGLYEVYPHAEETVGAKVCVFARGGPCLEAYLYLQTAFHSEMQLWTLHTDVVHVY